MNDLNRNIRIEDYDYPLPESRIAYYPAPQRDNSKLLIYNKEKDTITDSVFHQLPDFLDENHWIVFNDSKVIHARLRVHNATGAAIEIFCLEPLAPSTDPAVAFTLTGSVTWKCMVGNARKWKHPIEIEVPMEGRVVRILAERGEAVEGTFEVTFTWTDPDVSFAEWIEAYGKVPLPPYIRRDAEESDTERYQTVYACHDGSVAAPTAGLHFTDGLIRSLKAKGVETEYVTLHVGAGTFKPVSSETIGGHFMHEEKIVITEEFIRKLQNNQGKRLIAVGTTVTRTLESLFVVGAKLHLGLANPLVVDQWETYDNPDIHQVTMGQSLAAILDYLREHDTDMLRAATRLIILPTYTRHVVSGLITNFHQPKSTLLLLISNFLGDEWRRIYRHALDNDYRFLSYGDANLYL
ncbi:MAG: S-adenosylmethionine:tRNA ribosyltransferase-isomerase [Bacteroidales bacterium]|nr:S-adenosylmethionine:tRNA ribosyltransferase-isomerase [Bacteroidales bacterium]MBR6905137.1 S-adenosylmethionine:tRNA ribosyltransferase-isomerase [Bacteroidales bacterium]